MTANQNRFYRQHTLIRHAQRLPLLIGGLLLGGCAMPPISPAETPSSLDARGPAAAQLADLWWAMFGLSMVIVVLVTVLLLLAVVMRQQATHRTPAAQEDNQGLSWPMACRGGRHHRVADWYWQQASASGAPPGRRRIGPHAGAAAHPRHNA